MSISSRSCTIRHIRFGTNVTDPSKKNHQVMRSPVNKQYYHQMVESENELWVQAYIEAQIEVDVSNEKQSYWKTMLRYLCEKAMHLKPSFVTKGTLKKRWARKVYNKSSPISNSDSEFRDIFLDTPLNTIGIPGGLVSVFTVLARGKMV
ncbi:6519d3b3-c114-4d18-aa0e-fb5c1ae6fa3e [Sclerotinia trifoliorum]|uniref:6519d3b3-c114-4d18-aa0e-fb5c1ae6fa3e n=1 Tax=Sclerotinia trifoliorum TaxID=28548 RepID=A0A8H2VZ76_9HELO|nr:6519d3b3-c114-4d18-aa0e-fb5c1ae6fa3e [Sclerotinia trifoliorum]